MKLEVLKTLVYADIFDYPLTAEELHRKLIVGVEHVSARNGRDNFRIVPTDIEETLDQLVAEGRVKRKSKYCFLPGRAEIVNLRKKREKFSKKKLKIAHQVAKIIKRVPGVKFIGVTGSVAAGNAQKKDDIDFFIITSPGWLWTTRLLVTITVGLTGRRRRSGDKKVNDKICLNLFVDQSNLGVFEQNLFTAYELIQLKPLFDRKNTYQELLSANQWVKEYLPNSLQFHSSKYKDFSAKLFSYSFRSRTIIERLFCAVQLWWMKKRKTTEITKPDLIAFHPGDISREVMVKYKSRLKNYE